MTVEDAHIEDVLPRALLARAQQSPDDILIQEVTTGSEFTVGEVAAGMLRWAAALRSLGVKAGDTLLTMLPTRPDAYLPWLGASLSGVIEVPVNIAFRGRMLAYVVNDSQAKVIVIDVALLGLLEEVLDDAGALETIVVVGLPAGEGLPVLGRQVLRAEDLLAAVSDADAAESAELGESLRYWDTSCIIYTSGTTGPSKGVIIPWREMSHLLDIQPERHFDAGRGYYSTFPIFHISGKQAIWISARYRTRLVLRDTFSLGEFWSDIERYDCTSTILLGSMATMLHRLSEGEKVETPLRHVTLAPAIAEFEEFKERFGVTLATGYGMTEIGGVFTTKDCGIADHRTCGRPLEGFEVRVVDEHDEEVPIGTVGELILRSRDPWMMCAGYWNMPGETARSWRNGWFHTGDGFRADEDGLYYFVDRLKDTIRRRGENISSFEVETLVLDCAEVAECAAIAVPSEVTEDDVKIVVVLKSGSSLSPEELHASLGASMPRFMVPRYIQVVDQLPKTPTLRVKKAELRASADDGAWDAQAVAAAR